jgi:serine/threonine-protein kinase
MAVLVIVTVFAVAVAMFFMVNRFARPIKVLTDSMDEIAQGRFEHRINEERKDEFGQIYKAFDSMAQMLQQRFMPRSAPPETPPIPLPSALPGASPARAPGTGRD